MTKVIKYSDDLLGWRREPGPLRVWKIVDGRKKNADGKIPRFSIQEVPEDRYDEVLDLMTSYFVKDEPLCHYLKAIDDPVTIDDFRKLWSFVLQKGIVVGAFLVEDGNPKPVLAGCNMTLVFCDITEKTLEKKIEILSEKAQLVLKFMHMVELQKSVRELYNIDNYITAFGLCVDPKYRGHSLGTHLLRSRYDMAPVYGIKGTSTVFTAAASQRNAAEAGFEVIFERDYVDVKNEDGTEMFPGIKQKSVKYMGKKFFD